MIDENKIELKSSGGFRDRTEKVLHVDGDEFNHIDEIWIQHESDSHSQIKIDKNMDVSTDCVLKHSLVIDSNSWMRPNNEPMILIKLKSENDAATRYLRIVNHKGVLFIQAEKDLGCKWGQYD